MAWVGLGDEEIREVERFAATLPPEPTYPLAPTYPERISDGLGHYWDSAIQDWRNENDGSLYNPAQSYAQPQDEYFGNFDVNDSYNSGGLADRGYPTITQQQGQYQPDRGGFIAMDEAMGGYGDPNSRLNYQGEDTLGLNAILPYNPDTGPFAATPGDVSVAGPMEWLNWANDEFFDPIAETGAQMTPVGLEVLRQAPGIGGTVGFGLDAAQRFTGYDNRESAVRGLQEFGSAVQDSGGNPIEFSNIQNANFDERPFWQQLAAGTVYDPTNLIGAGATVKYGPDIASGVKAGVKSFGDNPSVARILAGEVGEATAGSASGFDALVRARSAVLEALQKNRQIRESGVTATELASGRRGQVQGLLGGFEEARTSGKTGWEALEAAADSIPGGRLIKTTAGPIEVTPDLKNALGDAVTAWVDENPGFRAYDARTARDALNKVFSGQMPQPAEDKLLREILGDSVAERVYSGARGFDVPGAKNPNPTRPLNMGADTVPVQPPIETVNDFLSEEERGRRFFQAIEDKKRRGEEFIERLRTTERPEAGQMSLGLGGQQLSLSDSKVYEDGLERLRARVDPPLKPLAGKMTPAKIARAARLALGEAFALPRAIKSSLDLSAPLRQGAMLGWRHPKAAASAFADQIRALKSPANARKIDNLLDSRPNARIHKEAGLYRAPWENANLSQREEAFLSRLAEKLPGVSASNRAYATYLNKLRADSFDAVWNSLPELEKTSDTATALARFINVASGRGELPGVLEGAGPLLGQVLYSPRYVTSRPHALWMAATGNGSTIARKEALKTLAAYFVGTSTILALGKAGGIWDVELDPRSADFGKGRIGPLRYDFWTGYSQLARLAAQVGTGETKSTRTGEVYDLDNRLEPFGRFTRGKLNPTMGAAVTELKGKDYKGDAPGSPFDRILELIAPIQPQEFAQAWDEYGWEMALATLPGFLGAGTSVYEPTAEDRLDEIAKRTTYTDPYGNEVTGKAFRELPPGEKQRILSENPELATARNAEGSTERQQSAEVTEQKITEQTASDARLGKDLDPEQWRADYQTRKDELRNINEGIYYGLNLETKDPVLKAYYDTIQQSRGADGSIDWDKVDAYRAGLDPNVDKYISANTGLVKIDTPQVRKFEQMRAQLDSTGYFERSETGWAEVVKFLPEWGEGSFRVNPKDYNDYYEWRDAALDKALEMERKTRSDVATVTQIEAWLDKQEPAKGSDYYSAQWRDEWVAKNPRLAYEAWQYGYYNPVKEIKQWLAGQFE